ncbi:hypothetical protein CPC08DRAFT_634678 [Agrocybe pediades]|nr:hypothetical protein CPC08DRAFT_634678 [Agrocybe pediades]
MAGFNVTNMSNRTIEAFVSSYSAEGGDESWFTIPPGGAESWSRKAWELVAFKDQEEHRRGWYLNCENGTLRVIFHGLDKEIEFMK